jgi:hypothetical protein
MDYTEKSVNSRGEIVSTDFNPQKQTIIHALQYFDTDMCSYLDIHRDAAEQV